MRLKWSIKDYTWALNIYFLIWRQIFKNRSILLILYATEINYLRLCGVNIIKNNFRLIWTRCSSSRCCYWLYYWRLVYWWTRLYNITSSNRDTLIWHFLLYLYISFFICLFVTTSTTSKDRRFLLIFLPVLLVVFLWLFPF